MGRVALGWEFNGTINLPVEQNRDTHLYSQLNCNGADEMLQSEDTTSLTEKRTIHSDVSCGSMAAVYRIEVYILIDCLLS